MKYVDLAKKANESQDVETRANANAPVLKAELESIVKSQEAKIIKLKAKLTQAEANVDKARGYMTDSGESWLSKVNAAKNSRDEIAEDLKVAELEYDDAKSELAIFA